MVIKTRVCLILFTFCSLLLPGLQSATAVATGSLDPYANETPEQKDARMAWWRDARFGMFIHWGVYAVPAGVYQGEQIPGIGEWIMSTRIPVDEYKSYAEEFNPVNYDPEGWAALAKEAGMRYMVITSKHHDGFALYPSDVTDWDIADASPYGKDLLAPLAEAARAEGLKFGLYFSQAQDWVHPGGIKRRGVWDEAQRGDVDSYFEEIAIPQAREILTRYQPDVLWWDTPETITQAQTDKFAALLPLAPGIITNNRLGGGYMGDTETPEQFVPPTGFDDRDFEVCMTMNGTWGYKSWDHNWKSPTEIIRKLSDIASKGGNFLLNIGPKADGTIPEPSVEILKEVGAWMDVNGEAIYGTSASPFGRFPWGRSTVQPNDEGATVYLHVFDWPEDGTLNVSGFGSTPDSVVMMGGEKSLGFSSFPANAGPGIVIDLPVEPANPHATVIRVEVDGPTDFSKVRPGQQADGHLTLTPSEAYFHSNSKNAVVVEMNAGEENVGNWYQDKSWLYWEFRISEPGTFRLSSEVATPSDVVFTYQLKDIEKVERSAPADGGGHKIFSADEFATLPGYGKNEVTVPATGSEDAFVDLELGTLEIKEPGVYVLEIRPVRDHWDHTNLRAITMEPAGQLPAYLSTHSDPDHILFEDSMTGDWRNNWFIDGTNHLLSNSEKGLYFSSGTYMYPDMDNRTYAQRVEMSANHSVLWTKDEFEGDLIISYEVTRVDRSPFGVNILYTQAQGIGTEEFPQDIYEWRDFRESPGMGKYYTYMNALHISYNVGGYENPSYIRARRYPKNESIGLGWGMTQIDPDYDDAGAKMLPGKTYIIELEKTKETMIFRIFDQPSKQLLKECTWDIADVPDLMKPKFITEGRIGFRQMSTKKNIYSNFRVLRR